MARGIFWCVFLGLVLAGSWWGFQQFFESYEDEIELGPSGKAITHPFLAAQAFLTERGVIVNSEPGALDFTMIPSDASVFVASVDSVVLTSKQVSQALDWIESGGYLVVGVGSEIDGAESLLRRFDIEPEWVESSDNISEVFSEDSDKSTSERMRELNQQIENSEDDAAEQEFSDILEEAIVVDYFSMELSDVGQSVELEVLDRISLWHPLLDDLDELDSEDTDDGDEYADEYIDDDYVEDEQAIEQQTDFPSADYELLAYDGNEEGRRMIQFGYGEGYFTALSSDQLWRNDHIANRDHAYFLHYIFPSDSSLSIYYDVRAPSLLKLLFTYFTESMIALLCVIGLWLWRSVLRVAPIREVQQVGRRAFSEHLSASAQFLSNKGYFVGLLAPIEAEIELKMQRHYGIYKESSDTSKAALLADHLNLSAANVEAWFSRLRGCKNQTEFEQALKFGKLITEKL